MLKDLFHREAVADLSELPFVTGAYGSVEWGGSDGPDGLDIEGYHLVRDPQSGRWNLVHFFGATNRDSIATIVATIPKLEDAVIILRSVIEQDLKSRYAGIVNALHGRAYFGSSGETSVAAVERALEIRR